MHLTLGFSPCPNDTFIFDAMVNGRIDTEGLDFEYIITDVEEDLSDISFTIFPNPAIDNIIIDYPAYASNIKTSVQLFSIDGKLLKTRLIEQSKTQMSIAELLAGVYVIKVTDEKGIVVSRVVKEYRAQ